MHKSIQCTVNGRICVLEVDIRASLLDALRAEGLTGTKQGCGVGECGACTVLINGKAVDSCLYLAVRAEGKDIRTVEGEAARYAQGETCACGKNTSLSPMQKALVDAGAVQCGFCTPGMVMAGTALVEEYGCAQNPTPLERETIRHGMSGNLCRCTGYDAIVNAVETCLKQNLEHKSHQAQKG